MSTTLAASARWPSGISHRAQTQVIAITMAAAMKTGTASWRWLKPAEAITTNSLSPFSRDRVNSVPKKKAMGRMMTSRRRDQQRGQIEEGGRRLAAVDHQVQQPRQLGEPDDAGHQQGEQRHRPQKLAQDIEGQSRQAIACAASPCPACVQARAPWPFARLAIRPKLASLFGFPPTFPGLERFHADFLCRAPRPKSRREAGWWAAAEGAALQPAAVRADKASGGALSRGLKVSRFTGKSGQMLEVLAPAGLRPRASCWSGLGKPDALDEKGLETIGAQIVARLHSAGRSLGQFEIEAPKGAKVKSGEIAAHLAFGARLRSYAFDKYRTKNLDEYQKAAGRNIAS